MAKLLKLRRGTTTQHGSFTGAEGEVTVDTTKDTLVVHDGSTAGGHAVAAEDMENVSSAAIMGQVSTGGIAHTKIANGTLPSGIKVSDGNIDGNLTIESADIVNGTIVTADLADDAVTAAKIASGVTDLSNDTSPQLGGDLDSNGHQISIGDGNGSGGTNKISFGASDDLNIYHDGNNSHIKDSGTGSLSIKGSQISFDSADGSEYQIKAVENAQVELYHNGTKKLETTSSGATVTGDIVVTGTVDGVDVAALNTTVGTFTGGTGALNNGVTATTQSAGDATTKLATTAFVGTAVSNLVDSSPAALNTLNELAAAIGDDANFSTTITNSIATKLPLAGGTLTGNTSLNDNVQLQFGTGGDLQIVHDGSNSFISESGTGDLLLTTTAGNIQLKKNTGEKMIQASVDGAVDLYYDDSKKFETTNAGGQISGVLYADGGRFGKDNGDYLEFTTDARADLVINGNNEFRFESDGDFHADGDVIAFSTTIASDERLKENIKVVPDALDKVEALRGVTFDWKRDGTPSAGVIAQEVQEVLPEAVKEVTPLKGGDSHLSVNYHALTSILIESVKELSARVKELEGK